MARGLRKTPEVRISEIEARKEFFKSRIEGYKAKISDIDDKIKTLQSGNQKKQFELLMDAIAASGKTPEEVIKSLAAKEE